MISCCLSASPYCWIIFILLDQAPLPFKHLILEELVAISYILSCRYFIAKCPDHGTPCHNICSTDFCPAVHFYQECPLSLSLSTRQIYHQPYTSCMQSQLIVQNYRIGHFPDTVEASVAINDYHHRDQKNGISQLFFRKLYKRGTKKFHMRSNRVNVYCWDVAFIDNMDHPRYF